MPDDVKLTKKQRKTQAFRKGGAEGSAKGSKTKPEEEAMDVAVADEEGNDGAEASTAVSEEPSAIKKGKAKAKASAEVEAAPAAADEQAPKKKKEKTNKNKLAVDESALVSVKDASDVPAAVASSSAGSKRKRESTSDAAKSAKKAIKQRFDEEGKASEVTTSKEEGKEGEETAAKANAEQRRFIVFVGNMSFQTTSTDLGKHFAAQCGETPSVRLLTTRGDASKRAGLSKSKQKSIAKGKAADPGAPTSKGCAFVEFASHKALQKALQFHHTQFQGRSINVELTAGGGGKGQERKDRIQKKNKELEEERRKLHEKYVKGKKEEKQGAAGGAGADKAAAATPAPPQAQWGPRANAAGAAGSKKAPTKVPKWAASGANAIRLSG